MRMSTVCVCWCLRGPGEGVGSSGVTEGSQLPHGCWEIGLLQKQQVLLTDEPSTDETMAEFLNTYHLPKLKKKLIFKNKLTTATRLK